jgi:alcohol dehydrogenase (cytochrome c)
VQRSSVSVVPGFAQTAEELASDGKNTENVTTHGIGYDRKSYSPLQQINRSNFKTPTIYDGVMYVINGRWTFALDMETGRQIWRTPVRLEEGVMRAAINRGAPVI